MMARKLGWIGLGQMGQSHVANLLKSGFNLTVYNRDGSKCEAAKEAGAVVASSPAEVVAACDVTFVMLSNSAVTLSVYREPDTGVLAGVAPGKSVIDCASLDAATMRQLGDLVIDKGGKFLSAPVAGHSGMAANATCQFICGGDEALYDSIGDALDAMSKNKVYVGTDVGAASNHKVVLNGVLAKITASFAEGLCQADQAGLDVEKFKEIVDGHAMNSPLLQLCYKMMSTNEHKSLFMLQHMEKDARLANELAESIGQPSPVTAATLEAYSAAKEDGRWNEQNWTAVYESIKSKRTT